MSAQLLWVKYILRHLASLLPKQLHRRWSSTWGSSKRETLSWVATTFARQEDKNLSKNSAVPVIGYPKTYKSLVTYLCWLGYQEKSHLMAKITHTWIDLSEGQTEDHE